MHDAWVDARLGELGRVRTGPVEPFRERPWANVFRIRTDAGVVWLKVTSPETAGEVGLYAVLAEVVPERILVPLGVDLDGRRLLLPDGGPTLRESPVHALEAVLPVYGELQRAVAPHAERLVALGVADMRPAAMPERFDEAVAAIAPEDVRLAAARPRYLAWCEELAAAPGPASLDHNDLHSENMLAGPRFYDWGDAVVAHPFASLLALGILEAGPARLGRLRDAYLEAFGDLAPHRELVRTVELACRVGKVARALTWHRAVRSTPDADPLFALAPSESLSAVLDGRWETGF